jgi:hypothetical protein
MEIKTTLRQLVESNRTLNKIAEIIPPGAYRFVAAKFLAAAWAELQGFNEQQSALVRQYGVEAEKDGKKVFGMEGAPLESVDAFNGKMRELLGLEVTLKCDPLDWSKIGDKAQETLTVGDIASLGPLLTTPA